MDERNTLIALSLAGLHYSKPLADMESYFGSFQDVWQASDDQCGKALGKHTTLLECLKSMVRSRDRFRELVEQTKEAYTVITLLDDAYPENLRQIFDPPQVLYVKGKTDFDRPLIGIVGARKASAYGKWAAGKFSRELTAYGIGVVSGLAFGIDAASHQGCLDTGGYTIGVLGGGIDGIYPSTHRSLYDQIEQTGSIISEYGPGVQPQKHYFPARNRIISGLSLGVFVVEAGERSGALITADFAMEQGRDVYALPGNINQLTSLGTNRLIRDGARMIIETNDLIDAIGQIIPLHQNGSARQLTNIKLSEAENRVFSIIREMPVNIEMLVYQTGLPVSEVSSILTVLELKGLISQLPGKTFTVC